MSDLFNKPLPYVPVDLVKEMGNEIEVKQAQWIKVGDYVMFDKVNAYRVHGVINKVNDIRFAVVSGGDFLYMWRKPHDDLEVVRPMGAR